MSLLGQVPTFGPHLAPNCHPLIFLYGAMTRSVGNLKGVIAAIVVNVFAYDISNVGEIFDKCPIAENPFTSCLLLII